MVNEFCFKIETEQIIGYCFEVHNYLGKGLLEIVYKDALQHEFDLNNIPYNREKEYIINYKGKVLAHKFNADFVVFDKIIFEVKSVSNMVDQHYSQISNYLRISKLKIGLVANFGQDSVQIKRFAL
jgi:GxxExxY protein